MEDEAAETYIERFSDIIQKILNLFPENTAENRIIITEQINKFFKQIDDHSLPRPVDFNVSIGENNNIEVFFSKDWTEA